MFSVVIPYYKKRKYIERCIDSVLLQSFTDFEIILVDDGSQDDISVLCKHKYGNKVVVITQTNQGVSVARNKGITHAKHNFIAFLDADDCWSPFYLEYANLIIEKESDVKIIGSKYVRTFDGLENEKQILNYVLIRNYFTKQIFNNTLFTSSSSIILRDFFADNSFKKTLKKGEDLDVWFRAVASGGNAFYIKNDLVFYSDEDSLQVTKVSGKIEDSLLFHYKELYKDLLSSNENFRKGISKFIYLNLYPYYFSDENYKSAKLVLNHIPYKVPLMQMIYFLPFALGKIAINTKIGKTRIRQYLKFTAKHLG